jgi:hypothetical protein
MLAEVCLIVYVLIYLFVWFYWLLLAASVIVKIDTFNCSTVRHFVASGEYNVCEEEGSKLAAVTSTECPCDSPSGWYDIQYPKVQDLNLPKTVQPRLFIRFLQLRTVNVGLLALFVFRCKRLEANAQDLWRKRSRCACSTWGVSVWAGGFRSDGSLWTWSSICWIRPLTAGDAIISEVFTQDSSHRLCSNRQRISATVMNVAVFWDIAPCSLWTHVSPPFSGPKISIARDQHTAGDAGLSQKMETFRLSYACQRSATQLVS